VLAKIFGTSVLSSALTIPLILLISQSERGNDDCRICLSAQMHTLNN